MKKMYGQDQFSVIQPPITGPNIGATITTKPKTAIALFLASPENFPYIQPAPSA